MAYSFTHLSAKLTEVTDWLKKELSAVNTGRASIAFLDGIRADAYGTPMPLQQLANMNVEDARTIRVTPYAGETRPGIEKAVRDANLGVSVAGDDKGIRIIFPQLTTETREKYAKIVGKKLEEARVSVRNARDEVWNDIQKKEKEGTMSEDEKFRAKEDMEKKIKEANDTLDTVAKRKEEEVRG
ncbi:MAG: ribosome recycling factor [Patescibacteria group bacterium]